MWATSMTEPTILFVDDEAGILSSMRRLFRKSDIRILTAESAAAGLELMKAHSVNVVVSDQRMPGMSGTEFLQRVRKRYPDTIRCILSGYAEMEALVAAINDGHVYRFLAKPWDDAEIHHALTDCVRVALERKKQRKAQSELRDKAAALKEKSDDIAELCTLQASLLQLPRKVLEQLPASIAVLDELGRVIYANRNFVAEFGHLPGFVIGQLASGPWERFARDTTIGETQLSVCDVSRPAQIGRIDIGGEKHTLITVPPHQA